MITHEYVTKTYNYDELTGSFTYLKSAGCRKAGDEVGWVDSSNGISYRVTKVNREKVRLHRLAFFYVNGRWPNQIDHINGNGLDNRLENLREVFGNENNMNTRILKNNKSGIHGVSWHARICKWQSQITQHKKQIHLGYHDSFFEACCARKSAEKMFGFHPNHGAR